MKKDITKLLQLIQAVRSHLLQGGDHPPAECPPATHHRPHSRFRREISERYYQWLWFWTFGKYGRRFSSRELDELVAGCLSDIDLSGKQELSSPAVRERLKNQVSLAAELLLIDNAMKHSSSV